MRAACSPRRAGNGCDRRAPDDVLCSLPPSGQADRGDKITLTMAYGQFTKRRGIARRVPDAHERARHVRHDRLVLTTCTPLFAPPSGSSSPPRSERQLHAARRSSSPRRRRSRHCEAAARVVSGRLGRERRQRTVRCGSPTASAGAWRPRRTSTRARSASRPAPGRAGRRSGHVRPGNRSGIACDWWANAERDFDLARDLGLTALRLTVDWARVEPRDRPLRRARARPLPGDGAWRCASAGSSRWSRSTTSTIRCGSRTWAGSPTRGRWRSSCASPAHVVEALGDVCRSGSRSTSQTSTRPSDTCRATSRPAAAATRWRAMRVQANMARAHARGVRADPRAGPGRVRVAGRSTCSRSSRTGPAHARGSLGRPLSDRMFNAPFLELVARRPHAGAAGAAHRRAGDEGRVRLRRHQPLRAPARRASRCASGARPSTRSRRPPPTRGAATRAPRRSSASPGRRASPRSWSGSPSSASRS